MVTKKNLEGYAGFLIKKRIGSENMLESVFPRWPCFAAAYSIHIEHFLTFEHIQYRLSIS
jgi:hypothetical protein